MPATMPACSWSLPSVGEMLCTVCSSRSNCTGQRAVAQETVNFGGLTLAERTRDLHVSASDARVDRRRRLHDTVELDRDPLVDVRTRDLLHEVVVLERDVGDVRRGVRVVTRLGLRDVAAGEDGRPEEEARRGVTAVDGTAREPHLGLGDVRLARREQVGARLPRLRLARP